MKRKISNQFLINYLIVFLLSLLAAGLAFVLLSAASDAISNSLLKNAYPAAALMRDDYALIDAAPVVENGGGVQVVNARWEVVYSRGLDILGKTRFTPGEFTDFLVRSKAKDAQHHIDVAYNADRDFWLIVTFPTSIRLDVSFVYNREAAPADMRSAARVLTAAVAFYLLLLALFAFLFSRITSTRITKPLRKLCEATERLREGDYGARVNLRLKNEFARLQDTLNDMAERIQGEIALREQSEEDRKRLILDISHDLKNPLSSVAGYAELCLKKDASLPDEHRAHLKIIHKNSLRASRLLTELFELSRLESPAFSLKAERTDACECLRQICGELLPALEQAGLRYEFDIPDEAAYALIDASQFARVFHNLSDNAVRYNREGTAVSVRLSAQAGRIEIVFADDGVGIPEKLARDVFKPFVRADDSRNSESGASGLGLSIAQRIIEAHGGRIALDTGPGRGCAFTITLPGI